MRKVFVQIEVPEKRFCNLDESICQFRIWDEKQKKSGDFYWCALYDKNLKFEGDSFRLQKLPECLAAPAAMKCGHYPDALMNGDFNDGKEWCAACEQNAVSSDG